MDKDIKPKDLMVGNWVYDNNISKTPMKVYSTGKEWFQLVSNKNGVKRLYDSSGDVCPIPITKSLLKHLGFREIKEQVRLKCISVGYALDIFKDSFNLPIIYFFYSNHNKKLTLRINCGESYYDKPDEIKYVHEIQNIYHILTNKEFEIK
jgi:hypothetical protein